MLGCHIAGYTTFRIMIVEFNLDKASDYDLITLASMLQTFPTLRHSVRIAREGGDHASLAQRIQEASDFKKQIQAVCESLHWTLLEGADWPASYKPLCSECGSSNIFEEPEDEEFSECRDCGKVNNNPTRIRKYGSSNVVEIPEDEPRLHVPIFELTTSRRCGHITRAGSPCRNLISKGHTQCAAGHKISK